MILIYHKILANPHNGQQVRTTYMTLKNGVWVHIPLKPHFKVHSHRFSGTLCKYFRFSEEKTLRFLTAMMNMDSCSSEGSLQYT